MSDIEILKQAAKTLGPGVEKLSKAVLGNTKFKEWPASIDKHQCEPGGLAKHTREMWELAVSTVATLKSERVDMATVFLAILYHDVGKLYDYESVPSERASTPTWEKSDHCRLIHHISRSALIWGMESAKLDPYNRFHDSVLHCILSHHGCREWGSPVAPKTREAWLVHMVDMMSARMDDWHKFDIVKDKK